MDALSADDLSVQRAVGGKTGIRRVVAEQKADDRTVMRSSPNTHTLNVPIYVQTYLFFFFYPVAWYRSSELMMLKAQASLSRVTTAQLGMRNLLCSLSTEASSLERLPTSILITPLTEIRKSLFLTLPFSFSLCPVAFASRCSSSQPRCTPDGIGKEPK